MSDHRSKVRGRKRGSTSATTPDAKMAKSVGSPTVEVEKQLLEKLRGMDLAPSSIKNNGEALCVFTHLLKKEFRDLKETRTFIFKDKADFPLECANVDRGWSSLLHESAEFTLDISSSEACGYPLLGTYLIMMRKQLALKVGDPNLNVYVHHQTNVWVNSKRGQNPTVDSSLVCFRPSVVPDINTANSSEAAESDGEDAESDLLADPLIGLVQGPKRIPLAFFEYKPSVSSSQNVGMMDVCEVFLQAFYSLQLYEIEKCIFCLTDMTVWHYFMLSIDKKRRLSVEWCYEVRTMKTVNPSHDELAAHFGFIVPRLLEAMPQSIQPGPSSPL